jgi:GNAT superfamily N-acetyltransferase
MEFGSTYEREAAYTDDDWADWAARDSSGGEAATMLAFRGDEAVGVVAAYRDDDEAPLFHVFAMWVDPAARGHGLGRRLLGAIEDWIATSGGMSVQLSVADTARAARTLYETAGYVADGDESPSPHTPGVVHISMRKRLA